MTTSKKTTRPLRPVPAHELARVRGGGSILFADPGETVVLSKSNLMTEELSINFEKVDPRR